MFLSENTEFNEISFISKKHRIIFVRKSVADRSNRQCLRKINLMNQPKALSVLISDH